MERATRKPSQREESLMPTEQLRLLTSLTLFENALFLKPVLGSHPGAPKSSVYLAHPQLPVMSGLETAVCTHASRFFAKTQTLDAYDWAGTQATPVSTVPSWVARFYPKGCGVFRTCNTRNTYSMWP